MDSAALPFSEPKSRFATCSMLLKSYQEKLTHMVLDCKTGQGSCDFGVENMISAACPVTVLRNSTPALPSFASVSLELL